MPKAFPSLLNTKFLFFFSDEIPVRGFIGHLEEGGFLPHNHKIYLWAHLHFNIEYNGNQVGLILTSLFRLLTHIKWSSFFLNSLAPGKFE